MPEQILDGTGSGFMARVTDENRLAVDVSGATINIGSVSASVDSVYIQSGIINVEETVPTDPTKNNPELDLIYISSGTSTGITTGSEIGSVVKHIGAGSYVKVLTYTADNLTNVGSWS